MFSLSEKKSNELLDLLWAHQKEAINQMVQYIKKYKENPNDKAALVQMPTGSGKSGVIAVLSTYIKGIGLTLVLTPRKVLRDQISRDIKKRFFEKIGFKINKISKQVINVSKGAVLNLKSTDSLDDMVIVMTFNMLSRIFRDRKSTFDLLSKRASLVLVDEGHYEPADNWSICTREINAPTILFTATPYRNDFNMFNIDLTDVYTLTYKSAVEGRFIRDVEIIDRTPLRKSFSSFVNDPSSEILRRPSDFVKNIVDFYEKEKGFSNKEKNSPRIIIRCDNEYSIQKLAEKFIEREYSCIGIHENFKQTEGWERKNVPIPEETDAIVWIHQFKLMEGIDDHRFQILAIFEKINNARSLVQQIGRIIRNPNPEDDNPTSSYFLEHWNDYHKHLWNGFLKYDEALDKQGPEIFYFSNEDLISKLLKVQPKMAYILGRFCSPFNYDEINLMSDIRVPLRVNLYNKLPNFRLENFVDSVKEVYKNGNRESREYYDKTNNLCIILSVRLRNSPFLSNHTFLETDLFLTVIKEFKDLLGIYDSSSKNWMGYESIGVGHSINVEKLKKVFRKGRGANLKMVSLLNSNIGASAIRSRTITAVSIEETISGFDDYAQICTTAEGYGSGDNTRQYIGFSHGRISRYNTANVPLNEFLSWLDHLHDVVHGSNPILSIFSRYALEEQIPENTEARCILLDSEDIKDVYFIDKGNKPGEEDEKLKFKETCIKIKRGEFELVANEEEIVLGIEFDNERNKYVINDLNNLLNKYSRENDAVEFPPNIIQYFNQKQAFIILPETLNSLYVKGQFYSPRMKIGKDNFDAKNYELKSGLYIDNKIGNCTTEKGPVKFYENQDEIWDPESLLGIISNECEGTKIKEMFGNPDIIVCDDMANEIADFILGYHKENPRVVFIHAKANATGNSQCKTSSLHDVCSQAVKNVGYLAMFNDMEPPNLNIWDDSWKSKKRLVKSRIVKASLGDKSSEIWKKFREIINNPITDKEVWILLGNILSKKYFEEELEKVKPKSYVIQAAYLLHATMSSIASVGAKFRIICKK